MKAGGGKKKKGRKRTNFQNKKGKYNHCGPIWRLVPPMVSYCTAYRGISVLWRIIRRILEQGKKKSKVKKQKIERVATDQFSRVRIHAPPHCCLLPLLIIVASF